MSLTLTHYSQYRGDIPPNTVLDGVFEVIMPVGQGAFSTVYRARDRSRGRQTVALKILHSGIQETLRRRATKHRNPYEIEEAVTSRLAHEAVSRILRTGQTRDGRWYAVADWIEGETLKALIRKHKGGLSLLYVADLLVQFGQALSEMHRNQIVHRDLKPANFMVEHSNTSPPSVIPRLRILDFGLARIAGIEGEEEADNPLLAGTPAYMSPEQTANCPVDPRSDLYSLAAVVFELLTGQRAIQVRSRFSASDDYVDYLNSDAPIPSRPATSIRTELPEDVDDIFSRALARERHMRYPTVEMFCDDLEVVLRAHAVPEQPPSLLERTLARLRRQS